MRSSGLLPWMVPAPRWRLLLTAVAAAGAFPAVPLPPPLAGDVSAQAAPPSLDRVESLVETGSLEPARRELERWWDARSASASRDEVQRGLWLRGLLTAEVEGAELDYRRLVLEYPGGPYTDRALLRLGLLAHAADRMVEARELFARLLRDHPGSELRGEAEGWLARYGAPAAPSGAGGVPSPPAESGGWAVQLGAFSTPAGARTVADRARAAGFEPRLVRTPGSDLVRVRVGRFPDEASARGLLERVRARGLEATLVSDAHRETPSG